MNSAPKKRAAQKRILFLTGTRADFGKLKPLMRAVEAQPEFELQVFATGMHLLARYGSTWMEIEEAGFQNVYRYVNQVDGGGSQMDLVAANTIQGLGYYVREFVPDLLIVHGDRTEALAGAIVGAMNNILVGHVEGGELSGTVDELIRHAVTKLAHLHFVANDEAYRRLLQMGERESSVRIIGSPDIDVMLSDDLPTIDETRERYAIPFDRYVIFAYHPVTTDLVDLNARTASIVLALKQSQRDVVAIYPNNDPGSAIILRHLAALAGEPRVRVLPSLRFEHFLTLLRHADAIIGNSSAGIREAPVYGVPTLNLGTRQHNRFRHHSIKDVPEDGASLLKALETLPDRFAGSLHFGKGNSAHLFLSAIQSDEIWSTSTQKAFQDSPPQGSAIVTSAKCTPG